MEDTEYSHAARDLVTIILITDSSKIRSENKSPPMIDEVGDFVVVLGFRVYASGIVQINYHHSREKSGSAGFGMFEMRVSSAACMLRRR